MTPTQKKYVAVIGNLYDYKSYCYDQRAPDNIKMTLIMVSGIVKQYGRWYYVCQPIQQSEETPLWMVPDFKVTCSAFDEFATVVET